MAMVNNMNFSPSNEQLFSGLVEMMSFVKRNERGIQLELAIFNRVLTVTDCLWFDPLKRMVREGNAGSASLDRI